MNDSVYRVSLDVHKSGAQAEIRVKKGDNARKIIFALTDGGIPWAPGEGVTANFYAEKPGGTVVYNSCELDGSTVTYQLTGGTTDTVGLCTCEIRVTDPNTDRLLTSPRFNLIVDDVVYDDDAVEAEAETELGVLDDLIGDSEAWAKGTRNDEPVESTDPAYRNNSKHYANLAKEERLSATYYADRAAADAARAEAGVPVLYGTTTLVPAVILTGEQYQALVDAGTVDPAKLYLIYEEDET